MLDRTTPDNPIPYGKALADYRAGRTAIDMIQAIEDLPDGPVFDGAVLGLCDLEDAFARSFCTHEEMLEKCAIILEQIRLGRADFPLLAVAAEAYYEQHAVRWQ